MSFDDNSDIGIDNQRNLITYKFAIQFDVLPEITYLNQSIPILITELLPILDGFPIDVWISQESVDEGLDFCRVIFWVFSETTEAMKKFIIWFQAVFRDEKVARFLEQFILCSLEDSDDIEINLSDWTRIYTSTTDNQAAIDVEESRTGRP